MKIVIAVPDPSLREALMQRLRKRLSNDALEVACDGRTLLDTKAVFESLESCCDMCEHATDVIEQVIIKNT